MKYTVVSTAVADYQPADLWLRSADRQRVADAFDRIETLLKHDAHQRGREHPDGWRVMAVPPIIVSFRVSEEDCLATILSVSYRS
jgi:hypothetical protein